VASRFSLSSIYFTRRLSFVRSEVLKVKNVRVKIFLACCKSQTRCLVLKISTILLLFSINESSKKITVYIQTKTFLGGGVGGGGETCHRTHQYGQEADMVLPLRLSRSDYDIRVSEL